MAQPPHAIFPPPAQLLEMEPEEIAGFLLQYLREARNIPLLIINNVLPSLSDYAGRDDRVIRVLAEGWAWLVQEGLLAQRPDAQPGVVFLTRRAERLRTREEFDAYRRAAVLREETLDPSLAREVVAVFRRGNYDTAVFAAFREVEVRVRDVGGFPDAEIGVDLMHKAFSPKGGPLTDITRDPGEQVAMMETFAGAIGMFKNPSSHRKVALTASEAATLIHFSNYLLSVVESRRR
jgi:uncharacterized protein (TIGR02391 family)